MSKSVSLVLVLLLMSCGCLQLSARTLSFEKANPKKEAKIRKHAEKIKQGVFNLGARKDSVVNVKLRVKTSINGHVSSVDDESFTVTDQSGASDVIPYTNVKQVKGNNLSKGVWISIGVLAVVAFLVVIEIVRRS